MLARGQHRRHLCIFFFQAEDGIRDLTVTGVQTCALPISPGQSPIRLANRRLSALRGRIGVLTARAGWRGCAVSGRSEERRVGKEGRCLWGLDREKKR